MATKAMINGTLNLVIVEAENLKKKDLINKMDPYCVVEFNDETFSTEPHKKGHKNPSWEESLKIPVKGKNLSEKIVFSVYDKELIHDNKIGRAEFTLQKLADLGQKEDLCCIDLETFGFIDKHKPAGTLKIRINFSGDGWPGSEKESDLDLPKASAMPKKDDNVFQEQKNLQHFSDVDSGEKPKIDKDLNKHQDKDVDKHQDKDLNKHKKYLDDTQDKIPIHSKKEHSTEDRRDEPIHSEKKKDYDSNKDDTFKDSHRTGKKDSNKYDEAFDKDKPKHIDMDDSQHQLKQSDFQRDPVKDLPKEYRVAGDQSTTLSKSIQPEFMELGNLEEREPEQQQKTFDQPVSDRFQPVSDTLQKSDNTTLGPVGAWSEQPAKDIRVGQGPFTTSPTPVKPIEDKDFTSFNKDSTSFNTRRGSVGGTCDLKEREKMAEKENATSMLDKASDMLGRGKAVISDTVAGVSNYLSSDTDKSKTENQQPTGVIPKAKAAISDTVSSVSNYFTGTTTDQQQPRRGSVGGTCDLAEREKYAKMEQVQAATSGIVPSAKAAISTISSTLSSVTKPVSETVTNYFTGSSTTDQQPRRGSVGGTNDLAEREKMAKLEQVEDVKSGIVPKAKAAISNTTAAITGTLSSVTKPVSDTVSSVTNYFTGTATDQQQPRRGSVGGTCDLAEREKYAKMEQVQVATSGIVPKAKAAISDTISGVSNFFTSDKTGQTSTTPLSDSEQQQTGILPKAKAAISNTVASVSNYFTGQKDEQKDVTTGDVQDELHQGTTYQPTKVDNLLENQNEPIITGIVTQEPQMMGTFHDGQKKLDTELPQEDRTRIRSTAQNAADKGLLERGKEYITDTAAFKAVSDYITPKDQDIAPWKKEEQFHESNTPVDQLPATSLVNPIEMIPHDMREKSLFQKGKEALTNTASTVSDTASNTATNLKNYFAADSKESTDPNEKGLIQKAKESVASVVPSASNADRAPWKKEQFQEGNFSAEEVPATSLVNPNEMIPHDRREKSLFQKGKEVLENAATTVQSDRIPDSQFYDPQLQTEKEKMLQENNSNQLNIKDSLDQGKYKDFSHQNPEVAYHTQDV